MQNHKSTSDSDEHEEKRQGPYQALPSNRLAGEKLLRIAFAFDTKNGSNTLPASPESLRFYRKRAVFPFMKGGDRGALTGVAKLGWIAFLFYRRQQGLSFENQFGRGLSLRYYGVYASRKC